MKQTRPRSSGEGRPTETTKSNSKQDENEQQPNWVEKLQEIDKYCEVTVSYSQTVFKYHRNQIALDAIYIWDKRKFKNIKSLIWLSREKQKKDKHQITVMIEPIHISVHFAHAEQCTLQTIIGMIIKLSCVFPTDNLFPCHLHRIICTPKSKWLAFTDIQTYVLLVMRLDR